MTDNQDVKRVGFLLERTTRIVKLCFTKAFTQLQVDITPEQWVILDTLKERGSLLQVDIAHIVYKNTPTVSRMIDHLERKALISRVPSETDRRATVISLTLEGNQLVERCMEEINRLRDLTWRELSNEDFQQFTRIIDQVFVNMQSY